MRQELTRFRPIAKKPLNTCLLYVIVFHESHIRSKYTYGYCPMSQSDARSPKVFFDSDDTKVICRDCKQVSWIEVDGSVRFIIAGDSESPYDVVFVGGFNNVVRNDIAEELSLKFKGFEFIKQVAPTGGASKFSGFSNYHDVDDELRGWRFGEFSLLRANSLLESMLGETNPINCPQCNGSLSVICTGCKRPTAWSGCPKCKSIRISFDYSMDSLGNKYRTHSPVLLRSWNGDDVVGLEFGSVAVTGEVLEYIMERGWYPCFYIPVDIEADGATEEQIALAKSKSRLISLLPIQEYKSDFDQDAFKARLEKLEKENPDLFKKIMLGLPFGLLDAPPDKAKKFLDEFKID